MEAKKELWFYYNKLTKVKLGPFSINALCTLLIDEKIDIDNVVLCQSGWKKWENALQLPNFLNQYQEHFKALRDLLPALDFEDDFLPAIDESVEVPPLFPKTIQKVEFAPVINKVQVITEAPVVEIASIIAVAPIVNDSKEKGELRKHPRVPIELKIVFIFEKKTFRTRTLDLSLGGVKIVDPLPECYFDRTIQVFLSSPDQKISIKFEAELVSNTKSLTQLQFSSKSEVGLKHLEAWLIAVSDNQTKKVA